MPNFEFPFEVTGLVEEEESDLMQCGVYRQLSPEGKKYAEESRHLIQYLHMIPIEKIGIPKFYSAPTKKMRSLKNFNLIYPVNEDIAVHIFNGGSRNYYIPIEPVLANNYDELIEKVDRLLVNVVDKFELPETDEEKRAILEKSIAMVCKIGTDAENMTNGNGKTGQLLDKFLSRKDDILFVTPKELKAIKYLVRRDKVGVGILNPFIFDPYIEDISCSGIGEIFIEHKIFESLRAPVNFENEADLDSFVIALSEKIGKPVSYRSPIVDATLPDGSRINIVFGEDISKKGSNFTIRKFSETPLSVLQLIDFGTLNYTMAAYIWLTLGEGMNCFIIGETASGKTTTMNALTTFIFPNAKIISIEDTPELHVPHKNWLREVTRSGEGKDGDGASVDMFDLLKAALRQRPNEIIIGEIRGVEGKIAFQAMQTGHSAISTFHAASVEKLIQRLTGDPINIPKTYIDNLNLVIIQQAMRGADGRSLRRITSINEIVGYDPGTKSFSFVEVFKWVPETDTFVFTGNMNSFLLEQKIAVKRKLPENKRRMIYKDLEKREKVLRRMHEKGILNFNELFTLLSDIQQAGVLQ
jgi:flagellar protein FlaI